jgi:hypothetical protein
VSNRYTLHAHWVNNQQTNMKNFIGWLTSHAPHVKFYGEVAATYGMSTSGCKGKGKVVAVLSLTLGHEGVLGSGGTRVYPKVSGLGR